MKIGSKFLIFIFFMTFFTFFSLAAADIPRIHFQSAVMEIQYVRVGRIARAKLSFSNIGTKPLIIEKIKSTCHCTKTELSATKILPGKTATISVTFHAPMRRGLDQQLIYLYTNDPMHQRVTLLLKAHVYSDLDWMPRSAYLDWPVVKGYVGKITLKEFGLKGIKVERLFSEKGVVDLSLKRLSDQETEIFYTIKKNIGYQPVEIIHVLSNSKDFPEIKIPVYFRKPSPFIVSPARVVFWKHKSDASRPRRIMISLRNKSKIHIISIKPSLPCFIAKIVKNDDVSAVVEISLKDGTGVGPCDGYLRIETNAGVLNYNIPCKVVPDVKKF